MSDTTHQLVAPEPPLQLTMPEPVTPVKEPDAAAAIVPMREDLRNQAVAQADQFIADLLPTPQWRVIVCLRFAVDEPGDVGRQACDSAVMRLFSGMQPPGQLHLGNYSARCGRI